MTQIRSRRWRKIWILCWIFSFGVLLQRNDAEAETLPFLKLEGAPPLAFEDLIVFPQFATPITLDKSEYLLDDSLFMESGLGVNRYGQKYSAVQISKYGMLRFKLVSEGVAIYSGLGSYPKQYRRELLTIEAQARAKKIGIWSDKQIIEAQNIENQRIEDGFELIVGQVKSVIPSKSGTFINFGAEWKTDFTVLISPKNRAKFRKMGWKLESLVNKSIRVRGWLRNYNGPFMEIFFPEQIEILNEGASPLKEQKK